MSNWYDPYTEAAEAVGWVEFEDSDPEGWMEYENPENDRITYRVQKQGKWEQCYHEKGAYSETWEDDAHCVQETGEGVESFEASLRRLK